MHLLGHCPDDVGGLVKVRSRSLLQVSRVMTADQELGPFSVTFAGVLAGSWIRSEVGLELALIWDTDATVRGLTHYITVPGLIFYF